MNDIRPYDLEMLRLAETISTLSKDPSTKVGALLVDPHTHQRKSYGFNGMLRRSDDNDPVRNQRPEKYYWYEHAERNAVYNLARKKLSCSTLITSTFPDMATARAIAASNIPEVIILEAPKEDNEEAAMVQKLFMEHGIQSAFHEGNGYVILSGEPDPERMERYFPLVESSVSNSPGKKKDVAMLLDTESKAMVAWTEGKPLSLEDTIPTEVNAVVLAIAESVSEELRGTTAYVSLMPCCDCSLVLAASGVKAVTVPTPDITTELWHRWKDSFKKSAKVLTSCGVEVSLLDEHGWLTPEEDLFGCDADLTSNDTPSP